MRESQYSKTIEARGEHKGEVRARRAGILEGLQIRLDCPAPEPIRQAIEGTNDLNTLDRWFRMIFKVGSWEEFQAQMKQT